MRILILVLPLVHVACGLRLAPHRIEIQQGNLVTQEMVSQLKPGMTRDQVRFVLGTPLVADIFHRDRWDYIFDRVPENSKVVERRHVAVYFKDDRLARVDGDVVPKREGAAAGGVPEGKAER
jgi:outer membrane protein assembly factor BamE